jgi:hypothetical protein
MNEMFFNFLHAFNFYLNSIDLLSAAKMASADRMGHAAIGAGLAGSTQTQIPYTARSKRTESDHLGRCYGSRSWRCP